MKKKLSEKARLEKVQALLANEARILDELENCVRRVLKTLPVAKRQTASARKKIEKELTAVKK